MKVYKYLLIAAVIIIGANVADAQNQMSPYSRFGYGILNDNATSSQRAMGGVGYAMNNGRQINVMNPASYAACDSLTFLWDIGLDLTNLSSTEGTTKGNSFGGGLDYMTMQFPIGKIMGGSIGLVPYSSVGYAFGSEISNGTEAREGLGGINQLFLGFAIRPFKGLSLGTNISYNFGTTVNDTYIYTNESTSSTTLFERIMKIRDYSIQLGAQYTHNFSPKHKATIGATFTPGKSFHGNTWGAYYDITNDASADTIGYSSLKGDYTSPASIGAGVSYTFDNRLMIETDFTYQNWKSAKFKTLENFEQTNFDNRWKAALGVQFMPRLRGNYVQRINYRFGAYYNHDYLLIRNNNVRDYGVSVGFGLPTISSKTVINLGFEYKHRTTSPVNLITENYFNITIGINFNELWFWQSKIR